MDTFRSLEEFGEALRRRYRDQELRERLAALAVLREYFVDYAAISAVERLSAADLTDFALGWLLKSEEANSESAKAALATVAEWLAAIPQLPGPAAREIAALAARLERDVPRALTALQELREALAGERLPGAVEVEDEGGGAVEGSLTAGLDRVVRLGEVDYEAADQDEFIVQAVDGDQLTLRRAVSLPGLPDELSPVRAPAGYLPEGEVSIGPLRPGDILNLEVARGDAGWRILDVLMVVPGGYTEGG